VVVETTRRLRVFHGARLFLEDFTCDKKTQETWGVLRNPKKLSEQLKGDLRNGQTHAGNVGLGLKYHVHFLKSQELWCPWHRERVVVSQHFQATGQWLKGAINFIASWDAYSAIFFQVNSPTGFG
jgi:hypothetical protein